jgi:hypothetical protein
MVGLPVSARPGSGAAGLACRRSVFLQLGLLVCLLLVSAATVQAHEVRPGYLELRELDAQTYAVLWKVPARGDQRLGLYVRLPEQCSSSEPGSRFAGGAYIERWRATCAGGLIGSFRVAVVQWPTAARRAARELP